MAYDANQYTVYLLSKRDYSEVELRRKLKQKEYSAEDIDNAIATAQQHNWQSDERFCASYIRYRSQQGYGPLRLRQELKLKGVKDSLITLCFEEAEIDWWALAETVFHKKRPSDWDLKSKQKMWRYMLSHGFETDHFRDLMNGDYDDEYAQ